MDLWEDVHQFSSKAVEKATSMLGDATLDGQGLRHITEAVDKVTITTKLNERHPKGSQNINVQGGINFAEMTDADLKGRLKEVTERRIVAEQ